MSDSLVVLEPPTAAELTALRALHGRAIRPPMNSSSLNGGQPS